MVKKNNAENINSNLRNQIFKNKLSPKKGRNNEDIIYE
jgi:hypothetical protein